MSFQLNGRIGATGIIKLNPCFTDSGITLIFSTVEEDKGFVYIVSVETGVWGKSHGD